MKNAARNKENTRILIATTPIRPIPTEYPPFGSLAITNALKQDGFNCIDFYDIDALRPSYEEALQKIIQTKPDVLGISSVVSTAYGFAKELSLDVKKALPETIIVLGGNLGASAEILLRKTGIDFVVNGEGENTIVAFMNQYLQSRDKSSFHEVLGLTYLLDEKLINTGYQVQVPKDKIYEVNWEELEENSDIEIFFPEATKSLLAESTFSYDPRINEPHRKGQRLGTLVASKGCVARCTFCHRWDKGIRYVPVPKIMERLAFIIERYNVGFVTFGDENFGTDKRWLTEFCEQIGKFDVLWRVSGMRVNCVSPEYLDMMRESGCCAVYFGMETGSERMLQIMEKKVKLEDNYNAVKWIYDAKLHTTIQLVLGMPGENNETIKETSEFLSHSITLGPEQNPLNLSINYAQALPGTPLYEYARHKGLVGASIDDEESYLLAISDRDANDEAVMLPLTGLPKLITETWRPLLIARTATDYINKYGSDAYDKHLLKSQYFTLEIEDEESNIDVSSPEYRASIDTGYFNFPKEKRMDVSHKNFKKITSEVSEKIKVDVSGHTESLRDNWQKMRLSEENQLPGFIPLLFGLQFRLLIVRYPRAVYRLRFFLPLFVLIFDSNRNGIKYSTRLVIDYISYWIKKPFIKNNATFKFDYKSLRKIVKNDIGPNLIDDQAMLPLRRGR